MTAAPVPISLSPPPGQRVLELDPASMVEKQASANTLPVRNSCELSTPVSRIATAWPEPVYPADHAVSAPSKGMLTVSSKGSGTSSCRAVTSGLLASASRSDGLTLRTLSGRFLKFRRTADSGDTSSPPSLICAAAIPARWLRAWKESANAASGLNGTFSWTIILSWPCSSAAGRRAATCSNLASRSALGRTGPELALENRKVSSSPTAATASTGIALTKRERRRRARLINGSIQHESGRHRGFRTPY